MLADYNNPWYVIYNLLTRYTDKGEKAYGPNATDIYERVVLESPLNGQENMARDIKEGILRELEARYS